MAIDACDAIYSVHGTIFDPINSADLCKLFSWKITFHIAQIQVFSQL